MNILAQIFGGLATITNAIGIQQKNKKKILFFYIISGTFFIVSYSLLKAFSGVAVCIVLTSSTAINYLYNCNNKSVPKWLAVIMILIAFIISSLFYKSWIDLLVIFSSIPFVLMLIQKKERNIRLFTIIFLMLYATFDILVGAYTTFIGDIFFLFSTIIAIIRYDLVKGGKNVS